MYLLMLITLITMVNPLAVTCCSSRWRTGRVEHAWRPPLSS